MSNNYVLVNPYIHGQFKNTIKAKNSVDAAKEFYKGLSEHFNNAVPKFYFTIQKGGSGNGKYYHFKIKEERKKNNVSFTLKQYDIIGTVDVQAFKNRLTNFKDKFAQNGGKKKKKSKDSSSESESDDSSSSDNYKKINKYISVYDQPFYYWWYDPSIYRLDSYYIPTFYSYITPVIEIIIP